MKKIAIYNMKGGVGKTITTANLGHLYAAHKTKRLPGTKRNSIRKTLVIDRDPQGNLSQYFKDCYDPDGEVQNILPKNTGWPNLDILPGNDNLSKLDAAAVLMKDVENAPWVKDYDLILVDCPPAAEKLAAGALWFADYVIVPIRLDAFSTFGLNNFIEQLEELNDAGANTELLGVLITHAESNEESRVVENYLRDVGFPVFETKISRSHWVGESTIEHLPLAEIKGADGKLRPMSVKPAWQYKKLMNEIADKLSNLDRKEDEA